MTEAAVDTDRDQALIGIGATLRSYVLAVEGIAAVPFEDEEIDVLLSLPQDDLMATTAALIELAEEFREVLRDLDGRIFQLTASQPDS